MRKTKTTIIKKGTKHGINSNRTVASPKITKHEDICLAIDGIRGSFVLLRDSTPVAVILAMRFCFRVDIFRWKYILTKNVNVPISICMCVF